MSKIKTELYKATCKSHFCTHCERKLRARMNKDDILVLVIIFGIWVTFIGGLAWFSNKIDNSDNCYAKKLVVVGDNKFEYWTTHDINCKQLDKFNK